jgi:AcrR family transcriptional regulator
MPAAASDQPVARERLIDAAFDEFSAHGYAGARVDRIAAQAGCNKNLIYLYYRNKENLFRTVLEHRLAQIYVELPFTSDDPADYAARVADYAAHHPDMMRLMAWSTLERTDLFAAARIAAHHRYAEEIAAAQDAGKLNKSFDPSFLLTTVMAVATAWSPAFPFDALAQESTSDRNEAVREHIIAVVTTLCRP